MRCRDASPDLKTMGKQIALVNDDRSWPITLAHLSAFMLSALSLAHPAIHALNPAWTYAGD